MMHWPIFYSVQGAFVFWKRGDTRASMTSLFKRAKTRSFLLMFFAKVMDGRTWRIFFSSYVSTSSSALWTQYLLPVSSFARVEIESSWWALMVLLVSSNETTEQILYPSSSKATRKSSSVRGHFKSAGALFDSSASDRFCLFDFFVWRAGRNASVSATS